MSPPLRVLFLPKKVITLLLSEEENSSIFVLEPLAIMEPINLLDVSFP